MNHGPPGDPVPLGTGPLLIGVALLAVVWAYLALAQLGRRDPRGWSSWRSASFVAGAALIAVAVFPGALPYPPDDFRGHMQRHLLIGMLAPLLLVLGAPVTLLLRSLSHRAARALGRTLNSRPVHLIAHPVTALVLTVGGLAALYFTPLYSLMMRSEAVHALAELHFLLSGYLFAWVIAGPDPAPRRPSVPARLVVLGFAIAGHAILSQLLYAGVFTQVEVPVEQRQGAGEIMYFGGDLIELLIALALVTTWRPRHRFGRGSRLGVREDDVATKSA